MKRRVLNLAAALVTISPLTVLLPAAHAQVSSATATGADKNSTGAVIPGRTRHGGRKCHRRQDGRAVQQGGRVHAALAQPGTYAIVVELRGFTRYEQLGLTLSSGDHPTIDIPLAVGDAGQTVEVTAAAPLLGTEDANLGQVVPGELLENLPLSGRTPLSVAQFTVGVVSTTNPVGVRPLTTPP